MTYTHIKFDLYFDSDKTSYYSLLEKLKNELKKAYFNCDTDDEVMSDEEDMYSEFKEIESDDEEDVKIKKTQFNKELKAYRDVREKKAERIYIKQELKELAQKKPKELRLKDSDY